MHGRLIEDTHVTVLNPPCILLISCHQFNELFLYAEEWHLEHFVDVKYLIQLPLLLLLEPKKQLLQNQYCALLYILEWNKP